MSDVGEFYDVLTGTRIRDPARAADGRLYDFSSLTEWFNMREAAGQPIISPRTLEPMVRTLTRDAEARAQLAALLEDLALNDPGTFVKTLAVLRAVFDALDPLGDLLNSVLAKWKVRDPRVPEAAPLGLSAAPSSRPRRLPPSPPPPPRPPPPPSLRRPPPRAPFNPLTPPVATPVATGYARRGGSRQRVERQVVAD